MTSGLRGQYFNPHSIHITRSTHADLLHYNAFLTRGDTETFHSIQRTEYPSLELPTLNLVCRHFPVRSPRTGLKPVEMKATESAASRGSLFLKDLAPSSCGSFGQNRRSTQPQALEDAGSPIERQPRVSSVSDQTTDSFRPSPLHLTNDTENMSSILRKRPLSGGGTPTKPSFCGISPVSPFSCPLITRSKETTLHRCRQGVA